MIKKRCEYCGREFETGKSERKYCNYDHYVMDHPSRFSHPSTAIKRYHERVDGMVKTMRRISKEMRAKEQA